MRLLVTPSPESDESLIGYVLRLTQRNGYETPTVILTATGLNLNALHNRQFAFGGQWDMSPLSRLTGVTTDILLSLKYDPAPSKTSIYRYYVLGHPIQRYFIRIERPKLCPHCLRESNYCRRLWELSPVTACPIHRRMLLDKCPGCGKSVSWVRHRVSICPCGYDWLEARTTPVGESELNVIRRIHRLCGQTSGGNPPAKTENPLDSLDLEHCLSALSFVAGQQCGVLDTTGKFTAKRMGNAELHSIFVKAAAVFDHWPASFESFLEWKRTQPNESDSRTGLHRDFGTLYPGLYFNLSSARFDFMRRAFEGYVGKSWSGGYARVIGRRKGAVLNDRKYLTKTETRKRLRIDASRIARLVEAGKLTGSVRERGKKKMYLIEAASVERLELELSELLTAEQAAEVLNVVPAVIPELVRLKCLEPHRGPAVDDLPFFRFSRGAVEDLLKKLHNSSSGKFPRIKAGVVNFSTALRALSRRHYTAGRFLRDILDGRIIPCGTAEGEGVKDLLFRRADVRDYANSREDSVFGPLLGVGAPAETHGLA
jgi:hypothetical protein